MSVSKQKFLYEADKIVRRATEDTIYLCNFPDKPVPEYDLGIRDVAPDIRLYVAGIFMDARRATGLLWYGALAHQVLSGE